MKKGRKDINMKFKRLAVTVLCTLCVAVPLMEAASTNIGMTYTAFASTEAKIKEISNTIISKGVVRKDYTFTTTRKDKAISTGFHVMQVDLSDPYLSLQALSPNHNQTVGKRANVKKMATDSGAIAAINGDVFGMINEGAPLGTHINQNGLQVSPSLLKGMYAFGVTKEKKPIIDSYLFEGTVTSSTGNSFPLAGINKSTYSSDITGEAYSHIDALFIYTSAWGGEERPINSATKATEVLIVDNIVKEVVINDKIGTAIPENGYILRGHGKAAQFLQGLILEETVTSNYHLRSQTQNQVVDPNSFTMMVSGHTLLLDQGNIINFTRSVTGVSGSSYTSRSAIGYSADEKKVYFVTAEKSGANTGVNLSELQQILKQLGIFKAVNLDGGGSTTMVERKLASNDIVLSHKTQESSLRPVSNGIGVFTSAPVGDLAGIIVDGAELMFIGQQTSYKHRTYDTYYNPIADVADITYSETQGIGVMNGQSFKATKSGKTAIVAQKGQVKGQKELVVVGNNDLASLVSEAGTGLLSVGSRIAPNLVAKLVTGERYKIDGQHMNWEFVGFTGQYIDGQIVVNEVDPNVKYGYAIATYDGFSTVITFTKADNEIGLENFDKVNYLITNQATPADLTKGSVKLVEGATGQEGDKALQLSYEFTASAGTQASYAVFNGSGLALDSNIRALKADILGDGGNHWLRAELVDSKGTLHYVDLAKKVNWQGWKTVEVPVAVTDSSLKLRRIYAITLDATQSQLALSGKIAIDNLKQVTVSQVEDTKQDKPTLITLNINKKDADINGTSVKIDVAPVIKNASTYLPLRFVSEQMGAAVEYNQAENSAIVFYKDKYIKVYIGKAEYILNGERKQASVIPYITSGRTLVPIRLISESLGFKVDYKDDIRQVTITN